tara:strand:- start:11007 stop:11435 length:429 start_codon:yes stop_codon:yes gene_type:complete
LEYFGNIYPYLTEEEVKNSLLRQIEDNNLNFLKPAFFEMWASRFWIKKGFDGSTFIQDFAHPSICSFFHDYLYRVYGGGYKADFIFYRIQRLLKDPNARKNFAGVRVFGSFFRLRHFLKGRRKEISYNFIELFIYLKKLKNK